MSGTGTHQIDPNTWAEITHVALVPPHANHQSHPYIGRLLFWCRRHFCDPANPCSSCPDVNACPPAGPAALYAWSIRTPQSVVKIPIPNTSSAVDPFCSGHTWLWNGDLVIAGGNDFDLPFSPPTGHAHVFKLSFGSGTPAWASSNDSPAAWSPMTRIRWYPSMLALADGTAAILGNSGLPGSPPVSDSNPGAERTRDVFDTTGTTPVLTNMRNEQRVIGSNPSCTPATPQTNLARLGGYPRLFLLRSSFVYHAGPIATGGGPIQPRAFWDAGKWLDGNFGNPTCSAPGDRWISDGVHPELNVTGHLDGGAVHLITRRIEGLDPPLPTFSGDNGWLETVYQIGGIEHYHAGECCGCHAGSNHDEATPTVERICNPTPSSNILWGPASPQWDDTPPDLLHARADLVSVVLLDGSILTLGGERMLPVGCQAGACTSCDAIKIPELLQPKEVFGTEPAAWVPMDPHRDEHRYHSTAALLPSGHVVLAGGQNDGYGGISAGKSVEIFHPPYLFKGPRPEIDPVSFQGQLSQDWSLPPNSLLTFAVALGSSSSTISRVALIRPASMTHSFDFNQRYVECLLQSASPPDPFGVVTISVTLPPNNHYVPPGWYMLTVVDSLNRPSDAKWIRIQ